MFVIALMPYIGYEKITKISKTACRNGSSSKATATSQQSSLMKG